MKRAINLRLSTLAAVLVAALLMASGLYAGVQTNGFIASGKMHYYVKDYQGNVRQVTDADGVVEQDNHYYPYGMLMGESSNILASARDYKGVSFNPYLFGSKEYLTTGSANLLDFTARTYDPTTLLFLTQDPKAELFTSLNPYLYCGGNPILFVDPDGEVANVATAGIGVGIGFAFGSLMELGKQIWKNEGIKWKNVLGAGVQGAIVGATTGFTLGANLAVSASIGAVANMVGGTADRTIRGENTSFTDLAIDGSIGAGASFIGKFAGKWVKNYTNKLSNIEKGNLGEAITKIKYNLRGYISWGKYQVFTGGKTKTGRMAYAEYDFRFRNIFTGKFIVRESKFNSSGLTTNQKNALKNVEYDFDVDRTTSEGLGEATEIFIYTTAGSSR